MWLYSLLLYLHILAAVFWFGSSMFLRFIFVPALRTVPFEAQHPMLQAIGDRYGRAIGPIGGAVVREPEQRARQYGWIEFSGMLLLLALMVAMHAGY